MMNIEKFILKLLEMGMSGNKKYNKLKNKQSINVKKD